MMAIKQDRNIIILNFILLYYETLYNFLKYENKKYTLIDFSYTNPS